MSLDDQELQTAGAVMNLLPFVTWDRFTVSEEHFAVFGWIARDDGRSDFVRVEAYRPLTRQSAIGYSTSSALRSAEIGELLYGEESEHYPCRRVGEHFGALVDSKAVLA